MACSCGTHPSTYTKLKLGWLEPSWMQTAARPTTAVFTLHALALLQPPPAGRLTAIRIPSATSSRYFLVEARFRVDPYERSTPGLSSGIPSEGVVVYEIDEAAWPVQLRTPTALTAGQRYTNQAERLEIEVASLVPGGATISIRQTEDPACPAIRAEMESRKAAIRDLQAQLHSASPGEKAEIMAQIREHQERLKEFHNQATTLGCRLD